MAALAAAGEYYPPGPPMSSTHMTQRKFHWIEKLQVQLASAAALLIVYFWLYPLVRPWDPNAALSFLPYGGWAQFAMLVGIVWGLAAAAALLTTKSRPQGAMVATLIGAAGLSMRSPQMRTLLWLQGNDFTALFSKLIGETLLLAAVLAGAAAIIVAIRRAVGAAKPGLMWTDPLADAPKPELPRDQAIMRRFAGFALMLAISIILILVLLRTSDSGQVIFALLTANFLAVLAAQQSFPTRSSVSAWAGPMLIGILFYLLATFGAMAFPQGQQAGPNLWANVMLYACPLPIDWMTAGAGGGVLGYWISQRIREIKHIDKTEKDEH